MYIKNISESMSVRVFVGMSMYVNKISAGI